MPTPSLCSWSVAAVVLLALAGCGDSGRVPLYPVQGQITFGKKPMRGGGSIAFVPLGNQAGKTAGGDIDEEGRYVLTTYSSGDGCMAGEFRVVINQIVDKEPERTPDGAKPVKPVKSAWSLPVAERIPSNYSDYYKSPLRAKVEAKGQNELDFTLK